MVDIIMNSSSTASLSLSFAAIAIITEITIGIAPLAIHEVVAVARYNALVRISPDAVQRIDTARASIDILDSSAKAVYGVSTGFGALATIYIDSTKRAQLQKGLVRSHAAGSGPMVEKEVHRAI